MYGFIIPTLGWNLLTKLLAFETLEITRVMVGTGRLPDGTDPTTIVDLVQPTALATSTIPIADGNTCMFIVEYRNSLNGGLQQGFWLNEFGVYANDPDIGEVLLYYGSLGDFPQYVSPYINGALDIRRFPVTIALTRYVNVVLDYPAIAFMTAEDVSAYFSSTLLPIALSETARLITIHNTHEDAHPNLQSIISNVDGRVGRVEEMLINNITGNPFLVTFGDISDIEITGVWNQQQQRVEF